ncbi:hypothetical protein WDW37_00075 [Bdellovibrionota bacterium FG-1]
MEMKRVMRFTMIFIMAFCLNLARGAEKKGEKTMQTAGTATGTFTLNPKATFEQGEDKVKTIKLSYVRAQKRIDPIDEATRNIPFNKKKREIRIVLSDQPISDEAMEDEVGVTMLVQTGKLQALDLSLTEKGEPSGGTMLYQMMSRSLNEESFRFEKKTFNNKTVAGKISMDGLTATFSAPIQPEPKPTAQGAAAANSEPGKVVAEYMRAMHAKDVAALKQVCQESVIQRIEGPDGKGYMQSINDWLKPGLQIVRVYEHSNWAKIDMETPDGSYTTSTKTIRINGAWKK